jgi:hypothetical protein
VIGEAIDTALTFGLALAGWVIFLATVASILTLAAIATGAWGVRVLWRRSVGPSWARGRLRARILARARSRRPSGHTRPRNYEEAA